MNDVENDDGDDDGGGGCIDDGDDDSRKGVGCGWDEGVWVSGGTCGEDSGHGLTFS